MKKNNSGFNNNIERIAWLGHYTKPEKVESAIKLDSNENFALDRDFITGVATEAAKQVDLREYPLSQVDELYTKLATYAGVSGECVAVGSGSDQIINCCYQLLEVDMLPSFLPHFHILLTGASFTV